MSPEKTVKIVLKRCDTAVETVTKPKHHGASKTENDSPNFCVTTVKVENEFVESNIVSTDTTKGETSNTVTGNAFTSEADYFSEMLNDCSNPERFQSLQTDIVVKTEWEEEKDLIAGELVECTLGDDLLKGGSHEKIVAGNVNNLQGNDAIHWNSQKNHEEFDCPPTDFCIKTKGKEEKIAAVDESYRTIHNQMGKTLNDSQGNASYFNLQTDSKQFDFSQPVFIKTGKIDTKGGLVISELVGHLPIDLKNNEDGSKPPQVVKTENEAIIGSDAVGSREFSNKVTSKESVKGQQAPIILSQIHSEKNSCKKLFACCECPYTTNREVCLIIHNRIHSSEKSSQKKPYVCKVCSATFTHVQSLNDHSKVHDNRTLFIVREKPYSSQQFGRVILSQDHALKMHADQESLSRIECRDEFRSKQNPEPSGNLGENCIPELGQVNFF